MGQLEERGWGRSPSSCSPSILTFSWGHLAICAPSFQKVSLLFFTNKIISAKPFQFLRRMLHSSNTGKTRLGSFPCGSRTDGGVRNVSREQVGSECGEWLTEGLSAAPCRCSRIEPNERDNCGFPGITSDQCFASGCCFNSSIRGVPWCFTPLPKQGNLPQVPDPLPRPMARVQDPLHGARGHWPRQAHREEKTRPLSPRPCLEPRGQLFALSTDVCENPSALLYLRDKQLSGPSQLQKCDF